MFAIIIPAYNDGESLSMLLMALDAQLKQTDFLVDVVIVNDGGEGYANYIGNLEKIQKVMEISLVTNLGHQRAIAVGLTELAMKDSYDAVLIMDGDGEDKPEDVIRLLKAHTDQLDKIIVAQRTTRSETLGFRVFYRIYKNLFRSLTGRQIDFGNFMVLPANSVTSLVHNANLWNHLAATVLAANSTLYRLPTDRGNRYKGQSKMNFERLVTHGLSAMSVFLPQMFTRILAVLAGMLGFSVVGIGVVLGIRYLTDLAIPGWATNLVGMLFIIILQGLLLLSVSAFAALNQRNVLPLIPRLHLQQYIHSIEVLYPREEDV